MSKRTTAKVAEQPDLLGAQAQSGQSKSQVAKAEPKPKGQQVAKVEQLRPTPQNMLQIIANAVADPRCDVTKMQALLDMQKQIEDRDAQKAFTADFMALQADLSGVTIRMDGKIEIDSRQRPDGRSTRKQVTPYATFNNIMRHVKPLLQKHHFTLSFRTLPSPDGSRIIVEGILAHALGHKETTSFPLPSETSGSKNNVQGWGSAMSYGKRYCTIALLNIISEAPEDRDRNGSAPKDTKASAKAEASEPEVVEGEAVELCDEDQVMRMRESLEDCGAPWKSVSKTFPYKSVAEIPASRYQEFLDACKNYKESHR